MSLRHLFLIDPGTTRTFFSADPARLKCLRKSAVNSGGKIKLKLNFLFHHGISNNGLL